MPKHEQNPLMKLFHRRPHRTTYAVSVVYFSLTLVWMTGINLDDPNVPQSLSPILGVSLYVLCVLTYSLGPTLFLWLTRRAQLKLHSWRTLVYVPAFWIVSEFLRSLLLSLFLAGRGGSIGDFWMFGHIGMWAAGTPLIYAARFGGIYLLSGLCVSLFAGLLVTFRARKLRYLLAPLCIAITLSLAGWIGYRTTSGTTISVGAVQILRPDEQDKSENTVLSVTKKMPEKSFDAVLLPEYSSYWMSEPSDASNEMQRILKSPAGLVAHSVLYVKDQRNYNILRYTDAQGLPLREQSKTFLIPGGEYVPYIYQTGLLLTGKKTLVETYIRNSAITPGNTPEQPYAFKGVVYGVLVCSGANNTVAYRDITRKGATVLGNVASVKKLGSSPLYYLESKLFSRFHAVANARPFVQSAQGGYAYIFDANGTQLASSRGKIDYVSSEVQTNSKQTPFTKFGETFLYMSFIVSLTIFHNKRKHFKK